MAWTNLEVGLRKELEETYNNKQQKNKKKREEEKSLSLFEACLKEKQNGLEQKLIYLLTNFLINFLYLYFCNNCLLSKKEPMERLRRTLALYQYNKGIELYEYELLEQSLAKFQEAIRLCPRFSKFWESAAMVQIQKGDYEDAQKFINKLAKFKSINRDYLNVIKGDNLMRLGEYRKAFRCYCSVSQKNRHYSGVKVRKIKYYMAIAKYEHALKISSGYTNNFYRHDPSHLLRSCEEVEFLHGICHFYLGRYSQAVKCLNRAAANLKFRNNPELLFYKGSSHYNIGEFQRAIISFEQLQAMGNTDQFGVDMILQLAKIKITQHNSQPTIKSNAIQIQDQQSQQDNQNSQSSSIGSMSDMSSISMIPRNQFNQKQLQRGKRQP